MYRRSCLVEVSRLTVRGTAAAPRRRLVLVGTCAAGLFLTALAPNALAQSTSKTKTKDNAFTTTVQSPCTGETVNIDGQEDVQTQTQQNGNLTKITFKDHQSGKGVGQASLAQYQYLNVSGNTSVSSTSCTFYVRMTSKQHLIRQGNKPPKPDDFFAQSRLLIRVTNCEADPTVESFDAAECK
jgi:hypothetical protein